VERHYFLSGKSVAFPIFSLHTSQTAGSLS
jgi:hypothetical protein